MATQIDNAAPLERENSVDLKNPDLTGDEELSLALQGYTPDTAEEKKLVRKIDFVLLPCLWWMYVLAYLDRGNVVSILRRFFSLKRLRINISRQTQMQQACPRVSACPTTVRTSQCCP